MTYGKKKIINTSIKLPLIISVDLNENKIRTFENIIENLDLVSNFYISKIDNSKIYYTLTYMVLLKLLLAILRMLGTN